MRSANTEGVLEALYAYEADIGVMGEVPVSEDLKVQILGSSRIVAFASVDFAQDRRSKLGFDDLAGLPLTPVIKAEGREAGPVSDLSPRPSTATMTAFS